MSFNATEVTSLRTRVSLGVGRNGEKILYLFNITDDTDAQHRYFERSRDFCRMHIPTDGDTATALSLVKIEGKEESDAIKGWGVLYSEGVGNTQHFAWIAKSTAVGEQWKWGDGTPFAEWDGTSIDGAFTDWRNDTTGADADRLCVRHLGEDGWRAGQCNYGVALQRTQYVICQQEVPTFVEPTSEAAPSSPEVPTQGDGEAQDRGTDDGSWQIPVVIIGGLFALSLLAGIIIAACVLRKNQAANKETNERHLGGQLLAEDQDRSMIPVREVGTMQEPLENSDLNLVRGSRSDIMTVTAATNNDDDDSDLDEFNRLHEHAVAPTGSRSPKRTDQGAVNPNRSIVIYIKK